MTEVSVQILSINDSGYELMRKAQKVLGEYSHFNTMTIYEGDKHFEICTQSHDKKYVTRTLIGRVSWKVLESYYKKAGEEEKLIFKK
jgi:hypothetical protein